MRNIYAIWGADPDCPAEVRVKIESWLIQTRGSELRKAKSIEAALQAVSMVSCLWRSDPEQAKAEREKEEKKIANRLLKKGAEMEVRREAENMEALVRHLWAARLVWGADRVAPDLF